MLRSSTAKKPSCGGFSRDGGYTFAGDKFGDVVVASTADGIAAPLLGHYCSTISSLAVSPDGAQSSILEPQGQRPSFLQQHPPPQ